MGSFYNKIIIKMATRTLAGIEKQKKMNERFNQTVYRSILRENENWTSALIEGYKIYGSFSKAVESLSEFLASYYDVGQYAIPIMYVTDALNGIPSLIRDKVKIIKVLVREGLVEE
jgi:hypothetical protein